MVKVKIHADKIIKNDGRNIFVGEEVEIERPKYYDMLIKEKKRLMKVMKLYKF